MTLQISGDDRYRLLIEAVTDYAIYMLDFEGVVASWNPGAQRIKGYEASEIIGHHFSRFYTEEDRLAGLPRRALETAAREGRFENEGWRVRKDGTKFWTHVIIDPIRLPNGDLVGFAKITRDLTERRAADLALRESEERFRLLVQGVTDYAIYMLDAEGNISNWNSGAERIKGYGAGEVVGRHFSLFYTPEDRENGEPARALHVARTEGRFEREGWRVRKGGTRFWAHVIIDPIRDGQGEIIGFAKVTRDITERKDTQNALEKVREAFFQSQKMEAIGQLTGGVAHDFNNLLSAIVGSLELLRKRSQDDPKSLQLIDSAMQGAQRGAALTQRMLAFARRQDLKRVAVDVPSLVYGIGDLLRRTLGATVTLEMDFPARLAPAFADTNQLELAILNLAVNARDAMPNGGVIRIAAREANPDPPIADRVGNGAFLCLSVTDTGEGMDKETLAHAIEPFFTTKGVGKGTGLGLSMVQGMAEQLGGRLALHSEKGKGARVEIWLPVAEVQPQEAAKASPDITPAYASAGLNILAVDDDALILMNTVAMLEDLGHHVFDAVSGAEALEILGKQPIDLVITDQAMPCMTGTDLAQKILASPQAMPIILATGYAELPDGSDLGLPRLAKPFGQADLARIIAQSMKA
ncbi:MAG: PAS domain S-box protein [Hyphomonadaceae bacterium]|nr:PAS domain S-box protein [Hyphomonadaceae bacterium]